MNSSTALLAEAVPPRTESIDPWAARLRYREYALLIVSLVSLGWLLPPARFVLLALTVAVVYVVGTMSTTRNRKLMLVLVVLLVFTTINHQVSRQGLPHIIWSGIGLEIFLVLRIVDWAVSKRPDAATGRARDRVGRFLLYLFFLPTVFAGPVPSYVDFFRSYRPLQDGWLQRVSNNASKILWGAARYFVIQSYLRDAALYLRASAEAGQSLYVLDPRMLLWGYVALFLVYTYVQFSGFCDMGIGIARIIGFQLHDNFDKPLLSSSPPRYWKSMNISSYRMLMTHVFYPYWGHAQLNQKIMTTFIVSGLWHFAAGRTASLDSAVQLLLAVSLYGTAVVLTLRWASTPVGRELARLQRTLARPVVWGVQWFLTLMFTALIHQLFWAGMLGQPLARNVDLFRRLFIG